MIADGGILEADWWRPWLGTKFPSFSFVLASLDTAYTEKQENDQSALTIWGVYRDDDGVTRIVLVWAWSDWLAFHALIERVVADCRKYRVDRLLIESKANGISVGQEIRRLCRDEDFGLQMIDPKNLDKVSRAHAIAHLFHEGIVQAPFVARDDDPATPSQPRRWAATVIQQCASFPRGRSNDLVDSTTQALQHLRGSGMIDRKPEIDADAQREAMDSAGPTRRLYPV